MRTKTHHHIKARAAFTTALLLCGSALALNWDSENVPTPQTLLLYHFNGTGADVIDSGPAGLNNMMSDPAARAGKAPEWLTSGTGDFVTQPVGAGFEGAANRIENVLVDFNAGFSMSLWFRYGSDQAQNGPLIYTENPRVILFVNNVGHPQIEGKLFFQRTGAASNSVAYEIKDNDFHHLGLVYDPLNGTASDGGKWILSIDGNEVSALDDPADLSTDPNISLTVGKNYYGGAAVGIDYDEFLVENAVIKDFTRPNGIRIEEPEADSVAEETNSEPESAPEATTIEP